MQVIIREQKNIFEYMEKYLKEAKLLVGRKRIDFVFLELSLPNTCTLVIDGEEFETTRRFYYREGKCFYDIFCWLADELHSEIRAFPNDFTIEEMNAFILLHGMKEKDL